MLRVDTESLTPGLKLALPVQNPRAAHQVLLRRGFALDEWSIHRLDELGIRFVWVQYPAMDFLDDYVSTEVLEKHSQVVTQITSAFEAVQTQSSARLRLDVYTRSIGELVASLVANPKAAIFLGDLSSTGGDYLMRHSSTVTYLSLLMGLKLEGYLVKQRRHIDPNQAKEVVNLGLGAMLHDIGITKLEPAVRDHYLKTGDENDAAFREHPYVGFGFVRGQVPPSAATIVLNHHQRFDGSGYAGASTPSLRENSIHVFARVVGLADEFDQMHNPIGAPPNPVVWVLSNLQHPSMLCRFDIEAMRGLFSVVPAYAPGTVVQLNTGEDAAVIEHVPWDPCRPIVQVIPPVKMLRADDPPPAGRVIDLSQCSTATFIAKADGADVSEINFPRPSFMLESVASGW